MRDWLYGPRFPEIVSMSGAMLRSLTLDIETLIDAARRIPQLVQESNILNEDIRGVDGSLIPVDIKTTVQYSIDGHPVPEGGLLALGIPDRNKLMLQVTMERFGEEREDVPKDIVRDINVTIDCRNASIAAYGRTEHAAMDVLRRLADYLYEHGDQRPDWKSVTWARRMIPLALVGVAWIWLAVTVTLPLAVHALILAVTVVASWGAFAAAAQGIRASRIQVVGRSFRFRGESRQTTYQRRADARQNVKVALWTAPIALVVGIVGTLVTTWGP